jgi:hypothetical protein
MFKKIVIIVLPVLLSLAPIVFAQEGAETAGQAQEEALAFQQIPDSLEGMIARALQSSPDIQVAEADLLYAQASLKQVRFEVSQQVVEVYHELKVLNSKQESVKRELARFNQLMEAGLTGPEEEIPLLHALFETGAEKARAEAMMRTILGVEPSAKLPESLEELLAGSFDNNPEIALAESKLARMDARFNQTRLEVTGEVTNAFHARRVKRNALDMAMRSLQLVQQRIKEGLLSKENEMEPIQVMIESEAELMKVEAHIRYLLGLEGKLQSKKKGDSDTMK